MQEAKTSSLTQGQRNMLMANQMFKDAFLVKKTRFIHLYPNLSDDELDKMTAAYFRKLNEEEKEPLNSYADYRKYQVAMSRENSREK